MTKVLVTGAAGFVGMHLSLRLLERGDEVVGLDNLNDYYDVSLKRDRLARLSVSPGFHFCHADLADRQALREIFAANRFERVVNLAAQAGVRYSLKNPYAYGDSNLTGFLNILEACRHAQPCHLVYASSSSVYGNSPQVPLSLEQNVDRPISLYAATKKANELMAYSYSHLFALPATGVRFFTVYGPWGRPDMAYFSFTKAILEGRPIEVYNGGHLQRDFTYIDDIVEGVIRILDRPPVAGGGEAPHRIYNLGNSRPVELMHFIQVLEQCIGRPAQKVFLPHQPGDVLVTYADISALTRDIGFAPSTSIEQGLARFVDWYLSYYYPSKVPADPAVETDLQLVNIHVRH